MLLGEYRHGIDPKGRIILPSKYREEFSYGLFIVKGLDQCLWLIPKANWPAVHERLRMQDVHQRPARAFMRIFYSGACETNADRQGRVLIPPILRESAGLDKEVVLVGLDDRFELWDLGLWQQYLSEAQPHYEDNAQLLMGPGSGGQTGQ